MVDISVLIVNKLLSIGFFNILIFILALTTLYAVLKRIKILGENPAINAIVAFSVAFFVFAFPVISGFNLLSPLSTYITQVLIIGLVFFGGVIIASIFYPDLINFLASSFKSRNILFGMIALSLALFVTSGLISIIYSPTGVGQQSPQSKQIGDIGILVAGLIIAFVVLLIASHMVGG